jgi:hypothetical protein
VLVKRFCYNIPSACGRVGGFARHGDDAVDPARFKLFGDKVHFFNSPHAEKNPASAYDGADIADIHPKLPRHHMTSSKFIFRISEYSFGY